MTKYQRYIEDKKAIFKERVLDNWFLAAKVALLLRAAWSVMYPPWRPRDIRRARDFRYEMKDGSPSIFDGLEYGEIDLQRLIVMWIALAIVFAAVVLVERHLRRGRN